MQRGSVVQSRRKEGPDVWQFRWSEKDRDGHTRQPRAQLDPAVTRRTRRHVANYLLFEVQSGRRLDRYELSRTLADVAGSGSLDSL
jgi:hypothetical protein